MAFKVEVTDVNIDIPRAIAKVDCDALWLYAAQQWQILIAPLIPMDSGALMTTVSITPGQIEYKVPYAVTVYFANWNWNKNKHPLATGQWDLVAISLGYDKILIKQMQAFIDNGGCNLG